MVNEFVQLFLDHPRRKIIVWAVASVIALVLVIPCWDHFSLAQGEVAKCQTELREIKYSVANLDLMQSKLAEFESDSHASNLMLDSAASERVREKVTQLAQRMHCRVRRLTMSDPVIRPWGENDNPLQLDAIGDTDESSFALETRTLTLSVGGTLPQLTKLTIALSRLDRFAVPSNMIIQREGIDGQLTLDVDISLFNLTETFD